MKQTKTEQRIKNKILELEEEIKKSRNSGYSKDKSEKNYRIIQLNQIAILKEVLKE